MKKLADEMTFQLKFDKSGNNKEYKVKEIYNNTVYAKESEGYLPGFYILVLWKSYFKKKTFESLL